MKFSLTPSLLLTLLVSNSSVLAGACKRYSPCGEVKNKSSFNMKYTVVLDDNLKPGDPRCDVWNWKGGNALYDPPRGVRCKQEPLKPGDSKGGGTVDVDAFTYADRDYKVDVRGGGYRRIKKGVWTKIQSNEKGTCWDNITGVPACLVELDWL